MAASKRTVDALEVLGVVQEDACVSVRRVVTDRDRRPRLLKTSSVVGQDATAILRRELEVGSALDGGVALHPLEMIELEGRPALLLEDFAGAPLSVWLRSGAMDVRLALRVAATLATALDRVHRAGLVHRNVTLENVYFDARTGEVKLTGFGVATSVRAPACAEAFLPEIAEDGLDRKLDLRAVGVVLTELLTGKRLTDDSIRRWTDRASPTAVPPGACANGVTGIIEKCLADRYVAASEIHDDLVRCLDALGLDPGPTPALVADASASMPFAERAEASPVWARVGELERSLSNEIGRSELLRRLTHGLVEETGARSVSFIEVGGDGWKVECSAGAPVEVPSSVVDRVVRTREQVCLDGDGDVERGEGHRARRHTSFVCLPVLRHGEWLGVLYLESDRTPSPFTEATRSLVDLLVVQAAVALENVRLCDELRQERAARLQSEAILRAVLDNMVDAVIACDRAGDITFTNAAVRRLFGIAPTSKERLSMEALRQRLRPVHSDGRPFADDETPLLRALAGEVLSGVDMTVRHPETGRATHVRVSAAPLQDERGALAGAVALAINVTAAVELDRLKEQFIRIVAHELKTPIAIVKGYADVLRRLDPLPETQRRLVDAMIRGTDRIDRLVTDLLLLWQIQSGRLTPALDARVDLAELVECVVARFDHDAMGRVRVERSSPTPSVTVDRQLLERAIADLVDNALRYSPTESEVEIRIGAKDGRAVLEVEDHGIGIPKDEQRDLFEPFHRPHADTAYDSGGLGLGLFVARAIAVLHGGALAAESEEGVGSTFRLTLPPAAEVRPSGT